MSALIDRLLRDNLDTIALFKRIAFKIARPFSKAVLLAATFGATNAAGEIGILTETLSNEAKARLSQFWQE